jgi:hypothetical protein
MPVSVTDGASGIEAIAVLPVRCLLITVGGPMPRPVAPLILGLSLVVVFTVSWVFAVSRRLARTGKPPLG